MTWLIAAWLFASYVNAQYVTPQYAEIRAVSAMCSSEGITASIDFDRPFNGKIYSLDYATTRDCLYYNNLDLDTVLFSIPAHRCGTKLLRTTRNMVDEMENRVYVQMDKETQTASDKQFSFVCRVSEPIKPAASAAPIVSKDSVSYEKDSYATQQQPIKPVVSSISTKFSQPMMQPVKPTSIPRVSAFSSDSHLGNWPIPGAKPYEPSMKPVASYPLPPVAPIVAATPSPPPPSTTNAANEVYVTPPRHHVQPLFPHLQAQTFKPAPVSAVHRSPPQPLHPPLFPHQPPSLPAVFVPPPTPYPTSPRPILPNLHVQQAVGVPFAFPTVHPTMVDADKWSETYATPPPSPFGSAGSRPAASSDAEVVASTATSLPETKNYREETPRVETPFSSDVGSNDVVEKSNVSDRVNAAILSVTQEHLAAEPEVTLEIQHGEGPYAEPVTSPIRIGDNITLVVKAQSYLQDANEFDMFVHSCFATDGKGTTKVLIIDDRGCVLRREFASSLNRTKDPSHMMYYFLQIKAFKFPGPDDVYFSCTIEFTPLRSVQPICAPKSWRERRDVSDTDTNRKVLRLFDNVNVELREAYDAYEEELDRVCPDIRVYILAVCTLLAALAISSATALFLLFRTPKHKK